MPNKDNDGYTNLNQMLGLDSRLTFMNHGFYPIDNRVDSDCLLQTSASLYLKIMSLLDTQPQSLLETGCGRGGGLDLISRLFPIPEVRGFDYNSENVRACNALFPHLDIYVDDVESPVLDRKYDVVLNLESSHCYSNVADFFDSVINLLEPNGRFLYGDCFNGRKLLEAQTSLYDKFEVLESIDITENVAQSCYHMHQVLPENDNEGVAWTKQMYRNKHLLYSEGHSMFKIYMCKIKD